MSSKAAATTVTLLVSEESQTERLDKFLAGELEERFSREQIQRLIRQSSVQVNDQVITKASYRLKEGETVFLEIPEAQPITLEPENIPLEVVHEDPHLLVVNKPTGMLTHPTGRELHGTLVNALLYHCQGRLSGINGLIRPGIVHRLDRETSGLLMVAKTDLAHRKLSVQLQAKTARRDYRAIVQGSPKGESGTVNAPVGRNPKNRDKMAVIETGRPAVTHWRVLERIHEKFSLMELSLETGRTYQIRVHMAHIGHPLLGDPLYGTGLEKILKLKTKGQLLQAFRLSFRHPETALEMTFEIPQDPDITETLALLRGEEG